MNTVLMLRVGSLACIGLLVALVACGLAGIPAAKRATLGYRGVLRQKARRSVAFRLLEPVMLRVAGWWGAVCQRGLLCTFDRRLGAHQARHLQQAGDYLGLDPREYTALCLVCGVAFGVMGGALSQFLAQGYLYTLPGMLFGMGLPFIQVEGEVRRRFRAVRRSLPAAIDLAALCVSAGLDFPSALQAVVVDANDSDVLAAELRRILDSLDIGHTRREALRGFERRVPIDPVRDLVRALIQAEEKGTPIANVLAVQARMARMQRSIAAEEAAARAGALLIVPMMLLLVCILLLLLGPFVVTGGGI